MLQICEKVSIFVTVNLNFTLYPFWEYYPLRIIINSSDTEPWRGVIKNQLSCFTCRALMIGQPRYIMLYTMNAAETIPFWGQMSFFEMSKIRTGIQ